MYRYLTFAFVLVVIAMIAVPFVKSPLESNPVSPENIEKETLTHTESVAKWAIDPAEYDNEYLPDFSQFADVREKKRAFFGYLKPLVEQINKEMVERRKFVESLQSVPSDTATLAMYNKLIKRYDIDEGLSFEEQKKLLLRRVDVLPRSLVLMQAANESGWGTSRFALEANNLFGQWCFKPGCGVVPRGRPEGETYEVRKFDHPIDSIRSYYNNLNTGHAYKDLRVLREKLRLEEEQLDAELLAEGLTMYSTRRDEYVDEIQTMIRVNEKYIK